MISWSNLDFSHHLSYGSRLLATKLLNGNISKFKDYCRALSGDSEYTDAQDFIKQAENTLSFAFNELLGKVELTGENYFSNVLASKVMLFRYGVTVKQNTVEALETVLNNIIKIGLMENVQKS